MIFCSFSATLHLYHEARVSSVFEIAPLSSLIIPRPLLLRKAVMPVASHCESLESAETIRRQSRHTT